MQWHLTVLLAAATVAGAVEGCSILFKVPSRLTENNIVVEMALEQFTEYWERGNKSLRLCVDLSGCEDMGLEPLEYRIESIDRAELSIHKSADVQSYLYTVRGVKFLLRTNTKRKRVRFLIDETFDTAVIFSVLLSLKCTGRRNAILEPLFPKNGTAILPTAAPEPVAAAACAPVSNTINGTWEPRSSRCGPTGSLTEYVLCQTSTVDEVVLNVLDQNGSCSSTVQTSEPAAGSEVSFGTRLPPPTTQPAEATTVAPSPTGGETTAMPSTTPPPLTKELMRFDLPQLAQPQRPTRAALRRQLRLEKLAEEAEAERSAAAVVLVACAVPLGVAAVQLLAVLSMAMLPADVVLKSPVDPSAVAPWGSA